MAASAHDERNDRERAKAIELAVGQIEKQFGKGSIMRLGGKDVIAQIPAISTGAVSLDYALGIGGGARGGGLRKFWPQGAGERTPGPAGGLAGGKNGGGSPVVAAPKTARAPEPPKQGGGV